MLLKQALKCTCTTRTEKLNCGKKKKKKKKKDIIYIAQNMIVPVFSLTRNWVTFWIETFYEEKWKR